MNRNKVRSSYIFFIFCALFISASPLWAASQTFYGGTQFSDYTIFTVDAGLDGAAAPSAATVLTSTNKTVIRDFSGVANNDLFFTWPVPSDLSGTTITFRVICFVSNATAPAEGEVIAFTLAGASLGDSDILSSALGDAITSSLTAPAGYAQYDRLSTGWSNAVTVTNLAAGETAILALTRLATTTDTYGQVIGVGYIEIKYQRTTAQ